jgi:Mg2+ and Co2+ transporter CorA
VVERWDESPELRKSLVLLRRIVAPMSEVVGELMRHHLHVVGDDLMPYYQDVYDKALTGLVLYLIFKRKDWL